MGKTTIKKVLPKPRDKKDALELMKKMASSAPHAQPPNPMVRVPTMRAPMMPPSRALPACRPRSMSRVPIT